jgi:hypothetical protein
VDGDWLSAWTLLDLFLLLIFSLAVFKLWNWKAGLVAFLAFGLGYHEPGAPRLAWLILLLPLALLRVVPPGGVRKWIAGARCFAIAWLLVCLVPFVATQIQGVIYPQLERQGLSYGSQPLFGRPAFHPAPQVAEQLAAPTAAGVAVQKAVPAEEAQEAKKSGVFVLTKCGPLWSRIQLALRVAGQDPNRPR